MSIRHILASVFISFILFIHNTAIAEVTIIYPFDGAKHPKAFPGPHQIDSYYLPISFAVTCEGRPHNVKWGINDNEELGNASFYDQITVQQIFKLPVGGHFIRVETDDRSCGSQVFKFQVAP